MNEGPGFLYFTTRWPMFGAWLTGLNSAPTATATSLLKIRPGRIRPSSAVLSIVAGRKLSGWVRRRTRVTFGRTRRLVGEGARLVGSVGREPMGTGLLGAQLVGVPHGTKSAGVVGRTSGMSPLRTPGGSAAPVRLPRSGDGRRYPIELTMPAGVGWSVGREAGSIASGR